MHPARLFIVCGLPGAGTTTRAEELAERFGAIRLSAVDWMEHLGVDVEDEQVRQRVETMQLERTSDLLRAGTTVVIECGSWMQVERERLRGCASTAGALVHLEFLDPPPDVLCERSREQGREGVEGSRAITRADLAAWSDLIERPTPAEFERYDPVPPVRAGARPGSPEYPYGSWLP